jgi:L-seryl-tRNA(Ser) seleniumtransferase
MDSFLRRLPSVNIILNDSLIEDLLSQFPRWILIKAIHSVLEEKRRYIKSLTEPINISYEDIIEEVRSKVYELNNYNLRRVINATGIIIHTNLGRSIFDETVAKNINMIATSYSNLEYDLQKGKRTSRLSHIENLICELSGGEASVVVNNNAAGVLLALDSFARGKEVIISRGELIEIGGGFRLPDIMKSSGVKIVEVGTTNRTYIKDYEMSISPDTGLILKVHPSNFKIIGFSSDVSLKELVSLGREYRIPVMEDIGSGLMIDLSKYGIDSEPLVKDAIKNGADIITFSGDKLIGGPQSGIIIGKRIFIDMIKENPLYRALRIDKLTLASLEATLRLYLDEKEAINKIPTLKMLTTPISHIEKKAKRLYRYLKKCNINAEIKDDFSQAGGGSLPLFNIPTKVISIKSSNNSVNMIENRLRNNNPPIIVRIYNNEIVIDLRTVKDSELTIIGESIKRIEEGG